MFYFDSMAKFKSESSASKMLCALLKQVLEVRKQFPLSEEYALLKVKAALPGEWAYACELVGEGVAHVLAENSTLRSIGLGHLDLKGYIPAQVVLDWQALRLACHNGDLESASALVAPFEEPLLKSFLSVAYGRLRDPASQLQAGSNIVLLLEYMATTGMLSFMLESECKETGTTVLVDVSLIRCTPVGFKGSSAPFSPRQFLSGRVHTSLLECPSGKLLLQDWLRDDEYTKNLDVMEALGVEVSLCSDDGRVHTSRWYAEQNVAYWVMAGCMVVDIWQCGDQLALVEEDVSALGTEAPEGWSRKGSISLGLRAVTLVDVQIAQQLSGKQDIEALEGGSSIKVDVVPGTYEMFYSSNMDRFEREGALLPFLPKFKGGLLLGYFRLKDINLA